MTMDSTSPMCRRLTISPTSLRAKELRKGAPLQRSGCRERHYFAKCAAVVGSPPLRQRLVEIIDSLEQPFAHVLLVRLDRACKFAGSGNSNLVTLCPPIRNRSM